MPSIHWAGILPSLPTPFDEAGAPDVRGFRDVVRFAVDSGVAGLVCFGLAGEVSRLAVDERERLLEAAVAEVGGDVPILTGATAENLALSQRLARHAEATGASAIVLPAPSAYRLTEGQLVDFFVEVASCTSLPVIVQDAPEYLNGIQVGPATVLAANARAANIAGVKLEVGPESMAAWIAALGDGFAVYGGNGGMYLLDCLRAGAQGIMPGVDTVDIQVAIANAERSGSSAEADELFARLLPLLVYEMQSMDHYNACAKHVLRRRGIDIRADLRLPGVFELDAAARRRLDDHVDRVGLVAAATIAGT